MRPLLWSRFLLSLWRGGNVLRVDNALETDFDAIDIDPFWNTANEKEHKIHRIHTYPAKFPAFITQKAITFANNESVNINCISDIFCGCGTVAYEAKRLGINFWGSDLNPTAVLIAKVKSNSYDINKIKKYYRAIIQSFDDKIDTYIAPEVMNERISYWFYPREIKALSLLKKCILEKVPTNSKYSQYFLCAFSNILKPTSQWLTKSIKPQIDPVKQPADVREAFVIQSNYMEKAIEESDFKICSKTLIRRQNALTIAKTHFTDLIITSPPYVTSYEYADLHQLSTLWLGFADDYRELRRNSLGSNHNFLSNNYLSKLNQSGRKIVTDLTLVDKTKAKAVAKYYIDMQSITGVCKKILNKNGMALMVIGNTEYKGVHINNVKHLVQSMYDSEFTSVYVTKRKISGKILTPYRDVNGRFSSNANNRKVYAEEFIVVGRN